MPDVYQRVLVLLTLLLLPITNYAGNWHVAGSLPCDDCHLQHGSDQQHLVTGAGFSFLLRKNSVNELCLSCHDGTDASAPDVSAPVGMYNGTTSQESAAGFFAAMGMDNPGGHALGLVLPTPLGTGSKTTELNCISCHASHGNGNYRNLLLDPASTGANLVVEVGTSVFQKQPPDNPPTVNGSAIAYSRDNIGYAKGMSAWCSSCHDQLSLNSPAASPAHFNSHPSDLSLDAFSTSTHADPAHWISGTGEGFDASAALSATSRLPFQTPGATDFTSSTKVQSKNEVFCLSCHKAHGSNNRRNLTWPYLESSGSSLAGCQQCHNK